MPPYRLLCSCSPCRRAATTLSPDALALLGEAGIAEATARATEAMMGDRRRQVLQARREVYDPEIS